MDNHIPLSLYDPITKHVDCYRTLTCFGKDINVKRNDYIKGYCLYALEIDPYYSFNIKRQGHCRLEMKFAKPLPESATLILYATFPEILNIDSTRSVLVRYMRGPSPLVYREEERHRALGRDSIFSWSRALTHPPRCNRMRHRDRHLESDFAGRHLGSHAVGAAILDRKSWGRHLGSEVTSNAL